jgi:hypothetical protein
LFNLVKLLLLSFAKSLNDSRYRRSFCYSSSASNSPLPHFLLIFYFWTFVYAREGPNGNGMQLSSFANRGIFPAAFCDYFCLAKFSCDNFVMQRELIPCEMFYDSVTLTSTWRSDKIKIKQKLSGEWWENICTLKSNRKANKLLIFMGFVKN